MATYSIKSFFNLELIPLLAYIIVTFDNREARNADSMLITFNFKSLGSSREEGMCLFLGALRGHPYITSRSKWGKLDPLPPPVTLSSHFHSNIAALLRDVTFCFYFPSIPLLC